MNVSLFRTPLIIAALAAALAMLSPASPSLAQQKTVPAIQPAPAVSQQQPIPAPAAAPIQATAPAAAQAAPAASDATAASVDETGPPFLLDRYASSRIISFDTTL